MYFQKLSLSLALACFIAGYRLCVWIYQLEPIKKERIMNIEVVNRLISKAIKCRPGVEGQVLQYYFVEDKTFLEMSSILGIDAAVVKGIFERTLNDIIESIQDEKL